MVVDVIFDVCLPVSHLLDACHSAKNWDERNGNGDSGSDSSDDPALTVIPGSSKSLSGVSHYRDLIQRLPLNVAQRILGKEERVELINVTNK